MVLEQSPQMKMNSTAHSTQAGYYEVPDPLEPHDEENPDFELNIMGFLWGLVIGCREILFKEVP